MPIDPTLLNTAVEHHQSGRLAEAERIYRRLLAEDPNHPDLWHLLGVVAYQSERPAMAVDYIRRAIGLFDRVAAYFGNLGEAYRAQNDFPKAERALRHALELDPNFADGHANLSLVLQATGRLDEALGHLDRALAINPQHANAANLRGIMLRELGQIVEARQAFVSACERHPGFVPPLQNLEQLAVRARQEKQLDEACAAFAELARLQPQSPAALTNLAAVLIERGRFDEAIATSQRALQLDAKHADAWTNLAAAQVHQQRYTEAEQALRTALQLRPDGVDALNNLATVLIHSGRTSEAEACLQQALKLQPGAESVRNALAQLWQRQGKQSQADAERRHIRQAQQARISALLDEGVTFLHRGQPVESAAAFEQVLRLDPSHAIAHSNYLFCHLYQPQITPQRLLDLHREFDRRHVQPLRGEWRPFSQSRDANRQIRLGFVSADLRHHPIGFLLARLFAGLDRRGFFTACYSLRRSEDETQQRLRTGVDLWRDSEALDDRALAEQIRQDAIDVLFDLSGHTSGNRLLMFARKPAPVQVSWMAYPATTGVSAIDYFLTDQRMTPPGAEAFFVERVVRLPEVGAVYAPPQQMPAVGPLPALSPESLTFGSFNNPAKIHRGVVRLWSDVLVQLPLSRLVIKFRGLDEPAVQERLTHWFEECGVSRRRLEFQGDSPLDEMLVEYQRIDLALDTFPYTGGTTTLLALLMGVPVVTLPGETMAARQSLSVLSLLGLDELIATDADDFVERVVKLARDLPRLQHLRATLRDRMLNSACFDAARFGEQFATVVRQMWRDWCDALQSRG